MEFGDFELAIAGGGVGGVGVGRWTEEKHNAFLSWMEECFVKRMLMGISDGDDDHDDEEDSGYCDVYEGFYCCEGRVPRLRLDRLLPDSATESTKDSKNSAEAEKKKNVNPKPGDTVHVRGDAAKNSCVDRAR